MHTLLTRSAVGITLLASCVTVHAQDSDEPLAILIPGSGTYSRTISTDSAITQQFFDQGLRMTWSFYFPESIASYQEAARHDPDLNVEKARRILANRTDYFVVIMGFDSAHHPAN